LSRGRAGGGGGELLVSIGHQPGAVDKLTVVVLKARNLPTTSDFNNGFSITGAGSHHISTQEQSPTYFSVKNFLKKLLKSAF